MGLIDYQQWVTGVPSVKRSNRSPWRKLPNEGRDATQLVSSSNPEEYEEWHFHQNGQGAFSFTARNSDEGLVIHLSGPNHDDVYGYWIILDDPRHQSYVTELRGLQPRRFRRLPNCTTDPTFRLSADKPVQLWVIYRYGEILVGEGSQPGVGRQILHLKKDPTRERLNIAELYHFGFSRLHETNMRSTQIEHVQTFMWSPSGRDALSQQQMFNIEPVQFGEVNIDTERAPVQDPREVLYAGQWTG